MLESSSAQGKGLECPCWHEGEQSQWHGINGRKHPASTQPKDSTLKKRSGEESKNDTVSRVEDMSEDSLVQGRQEKGQADGAKYTKRKDDESRRASGFSNKNTGDILSAEAKEIGKQI